MDFSKRNLVVVVTALVLTACSTLSNLGYDQADPYAALERASAQARQERKRILVVAGGSWCRSCFFLNEFMVNNADISTPVDQNFVLLKLYVGPGNTNEKFFARLPEAAGYPHFWVLSERGALLASQRTDVFEAGRSAYDKGKFLTFVDKWRQP